MTAVPQQCRCHNRDGLAPDQHENDCPLATVLPGVTPNPDGGVILHLPNITYLDTQAWSVDIGLTTEGLAALRNVLNGQADGSQP